MVAGVVVKANPCSNGGECPSSDELQNVVSLFQTKGVKLHRAGVEDSAVEKKDKNEACDWGCYLARYADLQNAFGSDQGAARKHYTQHGKAEARDCTCAARGGNVAVMEVGKLNTSALRPTE